MNMFFAIWFPRKTLPLPLSLGARATLYIKRPGLIPCAAAKARTMPRAMLG